MCMVYKENRGWFSHFFFKLYKDNFLHNVIRYIIQKLDILKFMIDYF